MHAPKVLSRLRPSVSRSNANGNGNAERDLHSLRTTVPPMQTLFCKEPDSDYNNNMARKAQV